MPKVSELCRHVRSKNAGPFWVTVDFFFRETTDFQRYKRSKAFSPDLVKEIFGAEPETAKVFAVDRLAVIKLSFVRPNPQAWLGERDMHSGQLFARLLDLDVDEQITGIDNAPGSFT